MEGEGALEPLAATRCLTLELHLHMGPEHLLRLVAALRRMLLAVRVVGEAPAVELFLGADQSVTQTLRQQLSTMLREVGEAWAAAHLPGTASGDQGTLVVPDVELDSVGVDVWVD